jgi:hypothetical protein
LLVLQVLSGVLPVTEAIAEAQISRPLYYQLETKALHAMLRALTPGAETTGSTSAQRIAELEAQVKQLEQQNRRTERMWRLARQLVKPGPVTTGRGRPRKSRSSTNAGRGRSPGSRTTRKASATSKTSESSIPTMVGTSEAR